MFHASVTAVSSVVPGREVRSDEIAARVGVPSGWIEGRTGISARRFSEQTATQMAVDAAAKLVAESGTDPSGIGMVIFTSSLPDRLNPPAAPEIANAVGATAAGAFDMNAACAGGAYGIELARSLVVSGQSTSVLVVAAEKLSPFLDYEVRDTAVLFGDGASAALIERTNETRLYPAVALSDGSSSELVRQLHTFETIGRGVGSPAASEMDGNGVYRWVRKHVPSLCRDALDRAGWTIDDVDVFVPHQANGTIIAKVAQQLGREGLEMAQTVETLGNTSSASMFQAMWHAIESGHGASRALLVGFGAGMTACAQACVLPG